MLSVNAWGIELEEQNSFPEIKKLLKERVGGSDGFSPRTEGMKALLPDAFKGDDGDGENNDDVDAF